MNSSVQDDLLQAVKVLRERGHIKNKFVDNMGCMCLVGAFNYVDHGHGRVGAMRPNGSAIWSERILAMAMACFQVLKKRDSRWELVPSEQRIAYLTSWNDKLSTTSEDVIELLEEAAGKESSDENLI